MFFVVGVEFYYSWLVNLDVAVAVCLKSLIERFRFDYHYHYHYLK